MSFRLNTGMDTGRTRLMPTLALATAGCLWGTGFYFGKIGLTEMPVSNMALFRFVFACIALLPLISSERRPQLTQIEWGWVFGASALGVPIQFLLLLKGLSLTTAAHASLMVGTLPILLAIAAVVFSGERMHFGGWLAMLASTCGASLIALSSTAPQSHSAVRGDLLVALSTIAAIAWILISQKLMRRHSALMVTMLVFSIGTAMMAFVVICTSGLSSLHYSKNVWFAVAEQGVFATAITTLLWNWGLQRVPASYAGIFVNLEPVVGVALGVCLLHEDLGILSTIGGALILVGAAYVTYRPPQANKSDDIRMRG